MIEVLVVLFALVGGLCLLFAAMAGLADYVLPALEAKPWRVNRRRPAATRRVRT